MIAYRHTDWVDRGTANHNLYLLHSSVVFPNFCKQFGPISGSAKTLGLIWIHNCRHSMVFVIFFVAEKVDFAIKSIDNKKHENCPLGKELINLSRTLTSSGHTYTCR